MVKDHSARVKPTAANIWATLFRLAANYLLYASFYRQDSTCHALCYTIGGVLAGTINSSMGPSIEIDLTTLCTTSRSSTTEQDLAPNTVVKSLANGQADTGFASQYICSLN